MWALPDCLITAPGLLRHLVATTWLRCRLLQATEATGESAGARSITVCCRPGHKRGSEREDGREWRFSAARIVKLTRARVATQELFSPSACADCLHADTPRQFALPARPTTRTLPSCPHHRSALCANEVAQDSIFQCDLVPSFNMASRPWTLSTLSGHDGRVLSTAISPDGSGVIATASDDRSVRLWSGGACTRVLSGHTMRVNSVCWSPDGAVLASASHDSTIRLWDPKTGDCKSVIEGHSQAVNAVCYSPDGMLLASCSDDGTIAFWDAENNELLSQLSGHTNRVVHCSFSPDGSRLASASYDNTVKIWSVGVPPILLLSFRLLRSHPRHRLNWTVRGHRLRPERSSGPSTTTKTGSCARCSAPTTGARSSPPPPGTTASRRAALMSLLPHFSLRPRICMQPLGAYKSCASAAARSGQLGATPFGGPPPPYRALAGPYPRNHSADRCGTCPPARACAPSATATR